RATAHPLPTLARPLAPGRVPPQETTATSRSTPVHRGRRVAGSSRRRINTGARYRYLGKPWKYSVLLAALKRGAVAYRESGQLATGAKKWPQAGRGPVLKFKRCLFRSLCLLHRPGEESRSGCARLLG